MIYATEQISVIAYGADPTGVNDSSGAITTAIAAAAAGNQELIIPAGTYAMAAPAVSPVQGTGFITIRGDGQGATTLKAMASYSSALPILNMGMPCEVTDLTIDGNSVVQNAGGANFTLAANIFWMAFRRVTFKGVKPSIGTNGWNLIIWNQNASFAITTLVLDDVTVAGPSATNFDAMAINSFTTCYVTRMNLLGLTRSPNFFQGGTLIIDGLYSNGCTGIGSLIIDAGVNRAIVRGLVVEPSSSSAVLPVVVNCPQLQAEGWFCDVVSGASPYVFIGGTGGSNGGRWKFTDSILNGGIKLGLTGTLELANTDIVGTNGYGIDDVNGAATTSTVIWDAGTYDGTSGFTFPWLNSVNGTNWNGNISGVSVKNAGATPITGITFTAGGTRSNPGYNPVGVVTPGVPASGSAVAAVGYDRTFYVTANAAGATTMAIQNGPTITLPLSACVPVRVPAGKTLTPTYVNAPTWVVEGE